MRTSGYSTRSRRGFVRAGLVATALLAGPCARDALASTRRISDDAERRIDLSRIPRRVFPAGAPAAVFVYCLAPDQLVGWPRALRADEAALLLPEVADLPELGRLTGRGSTAKLEGVLALGTDLVVDVGSIAPTYASLADQVQAQTGVPYLLFDGRFEHTTRTLQRLGAALGAERRAEVLATGVQSILDEMAELRAGLAADDRPRVLFARGPTGLATAAAGGLNAEVFDVVGAVNVAQTGAPNLSLISLEQVVDWQPDWIVASDAAFFSQLTRHPVWSSLPAVRAGRAVLAPRLPFGWFDAPPALNRFVGVVWLAAVLHPARIRYPLAERLVATFEWLYHRRPTQAQIDSLLAQTRLPR